MLKYRFLKNSNRLFFIASIILFLGNLISLLSSLGVGLGERFPGVLKAPQIVVYIFPLLAYLSLNDEKSAHRKLKDIKSQKIIIYLKRFIVFAFLSVFFKNAVTTTLFSLKSKPANALLSLFLVVSSYSFFLLIISIWCFFRDKAEGSVRFVSAVSVFVSFFYSLYKFLGYICLHYPISDAFSLPINSDNFAISQQIFCLVQYIVNIVMFLLLKCYFEKKEEELDTTKNKTNLTEYPSVYDSIAEEKGFGIDYCDDNAYI